MWVEPWSRSTTAHRCGHGPSQDVEAPFGGTVGEMIFGGLRGRRGGDVDDFPGPLGDHSGGDGLSEEPWGPQVAVLRFLPLLDGRLAQGVNVDCSGVVDEDVYRSQMFKRLATDLVSPLRRGEIGLDAVAFSPRA